MVSVPSVITEPEERAAYLVKHYWDKFDFTDTTLIHFPEITEQATSNYIDMMKYVPAKVAASSIKEMMSKASTDSSMFVYFSGLYEKYLYDPNSPMRDESLYIYVLDAVLEAPFLDEVSKIRPAHLLELALKNRVGEPATDFTYTLVDGKKGTLYHTKADCLLLFFYNPDCHACKEITDQLAASPFVTEWIKNNKLKILAVYPDEDYGLWTKTYSNSNGVQKISISESEGTSFTVPDNGLLATIKFKAIANATTSTIKFNNIALVDVNKSDIDAGNMSIKIPESGATTYTITYNPNTTDLVENIMSSGVKVEGKNYTIASAPSRVGYTFTGWNTAANGSGTPYAANATYSTDAELNLYAQWQIKSATLTVNPNGGIWEGRTTTQTYTQNYQTTKAISNPTSGPNGYIVRFNSNGGNTINQIIQTQSFSNWNLTGGGQLNGTTYTFGDTAGTLTAQYVGDAITLPTPTKTGATFNGWYTQLSGGSRVGGAGESYTPSSTTTLFAQWNEVQYTLTVNPNSGTWNGSSSIQTLNGTYNSTKTISNPTAPNGYTVTLNDNGTTSNIVQTKKFSGWTNAGSGSISGTTYTYGAGDGTITANYTANSVNLPTPSKTGYVFDGWYTAATDGSKITSPYMPTNNTTLYAHWTANRYTITFDNAGGQNSTPTKEVSYGQTYGTLPTPTKAGYTFDGWYNGSTKVTESDIVNITSNTTLTARWLGSEYTVTFDPDGGNVNPTTKKVINGGTYGTLPTPTKTGNIFKGWYKDTTKIEETTTVDISTNITLKASWEVIKYTLTVNPNGGTWNGNTTSQNFGQGYGTTKTISNPTATPSGYTVRFNTNGGTSTDSLQQIQTTAFDGWKLTGGGTFVAPTYTYGTSNGTLTAQYTGKNVTLPNATKTGSTLKGWYTSGTEGTRVGGAGDAYTPTESTTLFAQWNETEYTLTINPNGGVWNGSASNQTVIGTYNSTRTIANPTAPNGYTVTLNDNGRTNSIVQTKTFSRWINSGSGNIRDNTTYTFGNGDGTLTAEYTANVVTLPTPTKDGYTFNGWYTESTGGNKVNSPYTPNNDITLYSHWTANKYTITFNNDGGQNSTTTKEVTYGEKYGTLPTPTKDGYTFDGWFTSNGTKISENDNVNITENITLIAKWQGESYTLTVNPNGGTWNESSEIQTVVGTYNSTREISNPIAPKGYTVTLNDSENTTSIVQTKSFNGWTKTGSGTIAGTTYTFENGNGEIVANYTSNKVTLPIPTKEGYTFKGWFTQENGGTKIETSYMPESDITLYTQWEANKYTITFDGNGVTLEQNSKEVTYGQTYGELPEPTKEGYDFDGWYTEDGNLIKSSDIVNITKNTTLTASWSVKKYTVTFKNDDGSVLYTTLAQYGNKIVYSGKTPVSTKIIPGYESKFKGWENQDALESIQGDTTVTAIYEVTIIQYKIIYNNIRDCDNSKNPTSYTIKDSNITLENLEDKEGSKFLGWYDKAVEGNKVESIDTSKLENIILYAQWKDDKLYLKSEKYKIGENDIDNYEDGDIYLDKIQPETTLKQLMENCDTNGIISVIDKNGKEITEDEIVGTGMKIKVTRYGQQIQLTAVVMGDLDGDGKVSAVDLSTLNQVLLKIIQINGAEFKAADLDDNKKITATDLSTINNTILKNIKLTYDKSLDKKTNE